MGSNVVRLVRSEHEAMQELLKRCGPDAHDSGRSRRPARTQRDAVRTLLAAVDAHMAASRRELYPAAADPRVAAQLDDVIAEAASVERLSRRVEAGEDDLAALGLALSEHARVERRTVLHPLEDRLDVLQLRRIGEQFNRDRDAHLRADPRSRPGSSR